jgi:Protein of unknown function DUF262/Protein of unknown function (DUF1524)
MTQVGVLISTNRRKHGMPGTIIFEPMGIGDLLRRSRHVVPPNQRSYAWEDRNVRDLLQDINAEMSRSAPAAPEYFLGTIVLVEGKNGAPPSISDGQQRLATTSIILARIRDLLTEIGQSQRASSIEADYLSKIDFDTGEVRPQIGLNTEDNIFFSEVILKSFPHTVPENTFMRASNKRLLAASREAYAYLKKAVDGFGDSNKTPYLGQWVRFIKDRTHIIAATVLDENQAFRIFETLNDRGVKASQVDLLKNFFLETSGERMSETHSLWTEMTGKIEAQFPDEDDQLLFYIRHLWITKYGHTIEKDLSTKIRSHINSPALSANFVSEANNATIYYIALSDSGHPKWNDYKSATREYLNTINRHLKVTQIKPLLFAIAMHFSPEEATKAFRYAVSISVRFLIFGGRGGFLDEHYAARAHDIGAGKITKAKELRDAMVGIVPTNSQFESAFASARVSKGYLARYYLRAIDKTMVGDPEPEYVANEDYDATNLEHIVPANPSSNWAMSADEAASVQSLIGNLTLLSAKKNVAIGNQPFSEKIKEYKGSTYRVTNTLEKFGSEFGVEQIKQRQTELAKVAIHTWPLTFA